MKKWWLTLLCLPFLSLAQPRLSPSAEISVITCGPYQGELYSAFGHSAIRVKDSMLGVDMLYNYGVFDFNQPNFYLNFAKGRLNYRLALGDFQRFIQSYIEEDRYVHEQVLNLQPHQVTRLSDFLFWNAQPENMYYRYDYFYDNCATRIRDALKTVFKDSLVFDGSYIETNYSIRDLCDLYLKEQPWGDLGIDICLGQPMDVKATPGMHMFLPDYLESGLAHASIVNPNGRHPVVKRTVIHHQPEAVDPEKPMMPCTIMLSILLIGVLVSIWEYRRGRPVRFFDFGLFAIVGIIGSLLLILWVATDHTAAADNLNILWAIPLYLPMAFGLLRRKRKNLVRYFFGLMALISFLMLVSWKILPQGMNVMLIPLILLLAIRSFLIFRPLQRTAISS